MADAPSEPMPVDGEPCDAPVDDSTKLVSSSRKYRSTDIWKLLDKLPDDQKEFKNFCSVVKGFVSCCMPQDWKAFYSFYGHAASNDLIERVREMMSRDTNRKVNIFYIGMHIREIKTQEFFVIVGVSNLNEVYCKALHQFSITDEELLDREELKKTCRVVPRKILLKEYVPTSDVRRYAVLGTVPVQVKVPRKKKQSLRRRKKADKDAPLNEEESSAEEISEDDKPKRSRSGKRGGSAAGTENGGGAPGARTENGGGASSPRTGGGEARAMRGAADAAGDGANPPEFVDWIANLEPNRLAQILVLARPDAQHIMRRVKEEVRRNKEQLKSETNALQVVAADDAAGTTTADEAGAQPMKDDVRGDAAASTRRLPFVIRAKKTRSQNISENYLRVWDNLANFCETYQDRIKYRHEKTAERLRKQAAEEKAWVRKKQKPEPKKVAEEKPPESETESESEESSDDLSKSRKPLRPYAYHKEKKDVRKEYADEDIGDFVEPSTTFDPFLPSVEPNLLICRLLSVGEPTNAYVKYLKLPTDPTYKYRFYFIANFEVWKNTNRLYTERDQDLGPMSVASDHRKFFFSFPSVDVTPSEGPDHREKTLQLYRTDAMISMIKWDEWCRKNVKQDNQPLHDIILEQLNFTNTEDYKYKVFIFPACFLPVCSTSKPNHYLSCQCASGLAMNPFDAPICEYFRTRKSAYLGLLIPLHWIDFCKLGPLCYFFQPPAR